MTIIEAPWVPTVAAFIAVLSFLYALARTPETPAEIVLADAIFVASVSILVYRIETHLDSKGHRTLFRERPALALAFVALALGAIAGILAELASSDDKPVVPAIVIYERQVQEILGPLRETSAHAFKEPASRSNPNLYAKSARELSEAFDEASKVLAGVSPPRSGDHAQHSLLVVRLSVVGEAYARLGTVVEEGSTSSNIATAEARVQDAINDLREVEETLNRRGYRISLASGRG